MIELMFLKLLMLIRQDHQKECIVSLYWYFLYKGFNFQSSVCDRCHKVLMTLLF